MLRQYELVDRVLSYDPDADEALLNRAYVFSMQAHGSQKRASGDPYFSHPIEVAGILTDLQLDDETIATAILHDTIEDTVATPEQIEKSFGPSVARLVDGVTKLSKIEAQTENERAAENLRKFLLAMSSDIRVLLVKLADRLHNMRTLHHIASEQKRRRIARETMDIYAPLAERIGMYEFMREMQTLAFQQLEPDAYDSITKRLEQLNEGGGDLISRISSGLRLQLGRAGIQADIQGREKHPYSIWRKMAERHISFEQLSDVMAFRVIVKDVEDCYKTLGVLHRRWPMVPGRFKDYISTPKRNGYRSLHTSIIHSEKMRIEVQIRTEEMHAEAEFGLAAHWAYKQGKQTDPNGNHSWIRDLVDILEHAGNPEELLEHTKMAMYQDRIFAFTPKGALFQLPKGATPIDFAFAVHTNLGAAAVGAKINGRHVPLRTQISNGDVVEIIKSRTQEPQLSWLSFAVTGKARAAIRRATRMAIRKQYAGLGQRILERTFERAGKIFSKDTLRPALHRLGQRDVEDAIASVGRGETSSLDVLRAVFPDYQDERVTVKPSSDEGWFAMNSANGMVFKIPGPAHPKGDVPTAGDGPDPLPIRGLSGNAEVHFAPAGAVPGDRIVGIMEDGKGITIYPIQASALQRFENEPERWIDVRWDLDEANKSRFVARILINALNEPGTLATVAQCVARLDINIRVLNMIRIATDFTEMGIDLEVWDLRQLSQLLGELKELDCISTVKRVYD